MLPSATDFNNLTWWIKYGDEGMEARDVSSDNKKPMTVPDCFGEQCRKCEQYWQCEAVHGKAAEQWGE